MRFTTSSVEALVCATSPWRMRPGKKGRCVGVGGGEIQKATAKGFLFFFLFRGFGVFFWVLVFFFLCLIDCYWF